MESTDQPTEIPARFRKHGWNFKLIARTPTAALYSQSQHPDLPLNGRAAAYEVMRVRTRTARTIVTGNGQYTIAAGEYLPSSSEWGSQGWTFPTLADARQRLAEISTILHNPHTAEVAS